MWRFLANKILRNKIAFIIVLMLITVFMGYQATKIELTYTYPQILPANDPTYIEYENFRKMFGEDGSVMVIGIEVRSLFQNVIASVVKQSLTMRGIATNEERLPHPAKSGTRNDASQLKHRFVKFVFISYP